jgi:hypothetical protein
VKTIPALHRALPLPILLALSACGTPPGPCLLPVGPDKAYVVSEDWHSDIALPVSELDDGLQDIARRFPGARILLFGYGKESFMTAPAGSLAKYLAAPWPGEAAIEVTALNVDPADAYPPDDLVTLALPPGGAHSLSAYIRGDMADNPDGTPRVVAHRHDPEDAILFAANSRYGFLHTCNGWVATGLKDAGVPLSDSRVVTSERLMGRAKDAAARCETEKPGG